MTNMVTHNGIFHSDEVVAVALLQVFKNWSGKIIRTRDEEIISEEKGKGSYIIDVGGEYDGQRLFDHHQDAELLSSAGLMWKHIDKEEAYPEISNLVDMVDLQDRGIKTASSLEFASLVGDFNQNPRDNDEAFKDAVKFARRIIASKKQKQDELVYAEEYASSAKNLSSSILKFEGEFSFQWNRFINGQSRPEINTVVWFDATQEKWVAQVPPKKFGSMELHGPKFKEDEEMVFVHKAGFFCVAPSYEKMLDYLGV